MVILTTGGTIASRAGERGAGYAPALAGDDLVRSARLADVGFPVAVEEFARILSHAMTPAMMFRLAGRIAAHLRDAHVQGAVVAHGTATLEESAFMADLLLRGPKPAAFTGSMFSASAPDWDGARNLQAACRVAAAPEARGPSPSWGTRCMRPGRPRKSPGAARRPSPRPA